MDDMTLDPETLARLLDLQASDPDLLTDDELGTLESAYPPAPSAHLENLADQVDERELALLAQQVIEDYQEDEESRQEWQYRERDGIRLLGISENVLPGATFEGASEVVYPGIMEAVVNFQARALTELWPADGPVKSIVLGDPTPERQDQAERVEGYLNYLYADAMPGAFEETDRMLFRLPLSGSAFVKLCYDPLEQAITKRAVPTEDAVFPYTATDVRTAPRYTIVTRYVPHDLRKLQQTGFYRSVALQPPGDETAYQNQTLRDEADDTESKERIDADHNRHIIYEHFCYLDIEGEALPYYVHVEAESQTVLAIYRAWRETDPLRKPVHYVVHYRFLPGLGFYGYGYLHILSHLARATTGALRALLDSAQFANLQGGFRSRDLRLTNTERPIAPGEWRETQASAEDIKNGLFPLPYKEPSKTLFELLQWLDEITRRTAGTTEVAVGDAPNNAPVGTTLALIEQSQKVQTGVHIRLHKAQKLEFKLLHDLCRDHLPPEYPYDVEGQSRVIKATDFDDRIDIIPVSDPNVVSATQRVALAQAQLELAERAPDLYDRRKVHERLLQAMRVSYHEEIMPDQSQTPRRDPVSENMALTMQESVQAFQDQDHQAHLMVHRSWLEALDTETRKQVEGAALAHIAEHVALDYQLRMMQLMGLDQMPQQLSPEDEAVITQMAAQAAQLLREQPAPDPELAEVEREQGRKDYSALREIQRKDAEATNKIAREDALAIARMQERVLDQEEDMLQQNASDELTERGNEPT